jgi:hypothetical protein
MIKEVFMFPHLKDLTFSNGSMKTVATGDNAGSSGRIRISSLLLPAAPTGAKTFISIPAMRSSINSRENSISTILGKTAKGNWLS